jgi:hypothetical protein
VVEFGGAEEAVDRGGTFAAIIGAGEQPVLSAEATGLSARSALLSSISSRPSSR